nr:hypothetical protein [Tanacetum cinerariifolium]
YKKEVNEIRAKRIAKNSNPLALVAAAQQYLDPYYQAPPSKQASSTRSNVPTKHKGKEIAKPITPPSKSASEEDSDPEQAQRDKDMLKNLALYKKEVNEIRAKRIAKNSNPLALVAAAQQYLDPYYQAPPSKQASSTRSNVPTKHKGKEIAKPITPPSKSASEEDRMQETKKGKKNYTYHKEKMLLYKQAEKGVPLQAEQANWLKDTDEEIDKQELEEHYKYNVFANVRQQCEQLESIINTCVVENIDRNAIPDSPNMCDNDIQIDRNAEYDRVALANLIVNFTLDTEENKKILKQLKKANASLTQELKECKSNLEESKTTRDSFRIALQCKQTKLEKYMTFNDRTVDYDKLECKLNETLGQLAQKEIDIKEGLKLKAYEILAVKEKHDEFIPDREETLTLEKESSLKLNKDLVKPYDDTKQNSLYEIFKPAT